MIKCNVFVFIAFFFTYTTIVVTQPTSKVKVEKNKIAKTEKKEEKNKDDVIIEQQEQSNSSPLTRHEADLVTYFCKPVEFTPEGIAYYFKYIYNHPEYINYLPYNFSHMIQFLQYGIESGQNEAYAASVIKMFLQKVKAAPYIEAESFVNFMAEFPKVIKPYLEKKQADFLSEMQIVLKNKLSEMFARYFNVFQKNPDTFMSSLAEQIAKQTSQSVTQQHIEVEQIKKDVQRFFEICANKLIWSSRDDIQTWYCCNRLAHECQICLENSVLCDANALDDMCWSIIHRYCYFVDLSKDTLSKDFYAQVLHDLQTKPLLLTTLEEQEQLMISKRDHLICKLKTCRDICCPVLTRA
ncbi:hypothetical protein HYV10_01900 [Candidatus Dependentiae bacterium]|nr:hypothetical protein [Candidatus Dependentiae bacterium]